MGPWRTWRRVEPSSSPSWWRTQTSPNTTSFRRCLWTKHRGWHKKRRSTTGTLQLINPNIKKHRNPENIQHNNHNRTRDFVIEISRFVLFLLNYFPTSLPSHKLRELHIWFFRATGIRCAWECDRRLLRSRTREWQSCSTARSMSKVDTLKSSRMRIAHLVRGGILIITHTRTHASCCEHCALSNFL